MFKTITFVVMILFLAIIPLYAKDLTISVLAKKADVSIDMNEEQLLLLNGYRQAVTSELVELKLNSDVFWDKLEQKKMNLKEEALFLQKLFTNASLTKGLTPETNELKQPNTKLIGIFKSSIDLENLKSIFSEVTADVIVPELKSFFLLANIEIDQNMSWDDVGVSKAESFRGAILDSWKKLIEKEILGFQQYVVVEKILSAKNESIHPKSVILKWNSSIKKVSTNVGNAISSYELSAHYILQNTKTGSALLSFDFPKQKLELDYNNKKKLSSSLASLVYNLLSSQMLKINTITLENAKAQELSEIEIQIISKTSLSEIFQINNRLQEKFKEMKLTSQVKSYSSDNSILTIRAAGSIQQIIDRLGGEGGKYPLNEQKILLFNRTDKTFAILTKESNN